MTTAAAAPPAGAPVATRSKVGAFEGLRGIACLLVVLSHIWALIPRDELGRLGPLHGLTTSGNLAVSVFLVLGAFLVTRTLDTQMRSPRGLSVTRFWSRRLIRLGAHLLPFLAVLLLVAVFDPRNPFPRDQTVDSAFGIATFTLNLGLVAHAAGYRADIGPLWYLSVEQQFYVAYVFALMWFGRLRLLLIAALVGGAVASWIWRVHVLDADGWWPASLRTTTRSDGLLLGAAAGLAFPYLQPLSRLARPMTLPLAATLGGLVLLSSEVDEFAYLRGFGALFAVVTTLLVLAVAIGHNPVGRAERFLSAGWARLAGRVSFPMYIWHVPVFYAMVRWTPSWHWVPRTAAGLVILAVIVAVAQAGIERPVRRWLERTRDPAAPSPVRHLMRSA